MPAGCKADIAVVGSVMRTLWSWDHVDHLCMLAARPTLRSLDHADPVYAQFEVCGRCVMGSCGPPYICLLAAKLTLRSPVVGSSGPGMRTLRHGSYGPPYICVLLAAKLTLRS
jgi:hypothetical protein